MFYKYSKFCALKVEMIVCNFFSRVSDAPEHAIIWTGKGDVIDIIIPEILKFRVGKVSPFVLLQ